MRCAVESTDEFDDWCEQLPAAKRDAVAAIVGLLQGLGPALQFPYCSRIKGSRHRHMRELRIQYAGRPYRVLYAFDPRRVAVLLIGGDKTGNARWYDSFVPLADALYDAHLVQLRTEGWYDGEEVLEDAV